MGKQLNCSGDSEDGAVLHEEKCEEPDQSNDNGCRNLYPPIATSTMSEQKTLEDSNDSRLIEQSLPLSTKGNRAPYAPIFFTPCSAPLHLEGHFRSGHAFLVANGPSFLEVDQSLLAGKWVMTMNNGPRTYRGSANCTVDDPSRFSYSIWSDPTITKFVPMAHLRKPLWDNRKLVNDSNLVEQKWCPSHLTPSDCPNVVGYRRNECFDSATWLEERSVNWGNSGKLGGGRSVMLAALKILYLMGFSRVYLLGVDFEMDSLRKYHFAEDRSDAAIKGNMSTYAKLIVWFTELQQHFLAADFEVFNCNPISKLTAFPYLDYNTAILDSAREIGVKDAERTAGMYQKIEIKTAEGASMSHPA